jgi:hypothetical protein
MWSGRGNGRFLPYDEQMSDTPNTPQDIFVGNTYEQWLEIGRERGWEMPTYTRTRAELQQALEELEESTLLMDGFDEAFIGWSRRINEPLLAVYSYDELVKVCTERDGMSFDEAVEHIDYNVAGAWVGEQTPIIVMPFIS